jgi:hypothetical protein
VRIAWAIPCRYAEVHDGLATMVGAGTNIFTVPSFPASIGLFVVAHFLAAEDELGVQHPLRSQVLAPDMQPVADPIEGALGFEAGPNKPPGWEGGLTLPMVVRFPAHIEGTYTFELTVAERSQTVPLLVQGPT